MCAGTRQDTCQDGGMRTKRSNTQSGHDLAARVPALAVAEGGVAVAAGAEGSALVEHLLERDEVAKVGELHHQIEPTVRRSAGITRRGAGTGGNHDPIPGRELSTFLFEGG